MRKGSILIRFAPRPLRTRYPKHAAVAACLPRSELFAVRQARNLLQHPARLMIRCTQQSDNSSCLVSLPLVASPKSPFGRLRVAANVLSIF